MLVNAAKKPKSSFQVHLRITGRGPALAQGIPFADEPELDFAWQVVPIEHLVDADYTVQVPSIEPGKSRPRTERAYNYGFRLVSYPVFLRCGCG
jgi:hypothetical protein